MIELIPAQDSAYRVLKYALHAGRLLLLTSISGRGRTTVLRKLHADTGGFVTGEDFIETSTTRHPLSLEETLYSAVVAALKDNEVVYVDDIDLIHNATLHLSLLSSRPICGNGSTGAERQRLA